jgi:uncharacterized protein
MATSLLALLDDITTVLDDVALLSKIAAKKTAGVLGDDLALNAQQVAGVQAERELPVVWAVAQGSLRNKAILVPAALLISAFAPALVVPLLMIGGAYLCYEGFEKLAHKLLHSQAEDDAEHARLTAALVNPELDLVALERSKIKGAIRTDFVLSAEIIIIALGTVAAAPLTTQLVVLVSVALLMTLGVYGFVAVIVKLDDIGLALSRRPRALSAAFGRGLLVFAPWLMRTLSVLGTAAMFLVGGGILVHGLPALQLAVDTMTAGMGSITAAALAALGDAVVGVFAGGLVLAGVLLLGKLRGATSR